MNVQLKFLATYRKYLPIETSGYINEIEISQDASILELLTNLNIPINKECIVLINGKTPEENQVLFDGDEICLFPAMAGG
jgi:molybdopterin converting factor small subunit